MTDTFKMVEEFHEKFGLPTINNLAPHMPEHDVLAFRAAFLIEETAEYCRAVGLVNAADTLEDLIADMKRHPTIYCNIYTGMQDLNKAADALADLKYVTDGTAHLMGIPLNDCFVTVHSANMRKERANGVDDPRNTRPHALNVVKPAGWQAPDHTEALRRHSEKTPRAAT